MGNPEKNSALLAPNIYQYVDVRAFLLDWFNHQRQVEIGFSLRGVARQSGLSPSYLPLMLSGKRSLTEKSLEKFSNYIKLDGSQCSYLKLLRTVSESKSQDDRHSALKKLQRFQSFQNLNPKEFETFKYLTKWYYVAIRELAARSDFNTDPKWIQRQLIKHVPTDKIKESLSFLNRSGFIDIDKREGTASLPQKRVQCTQGIFQVALSQFHREMLDIAKESIDQVANKERNISGFALTLPKNSYKEVVAIIDEAKEKIAKLEDHQKESEAVYYVGFSAIPLTRRQT